MNDNEIKEIMSGAAKAVPGEKFVVIDDQSDVRKLVRMVLEVEHVDLHEAANGDEGLELVRQLRPDYVILDVMMPGELNGFDVCGRIKADKSLRQARVILMTALGRPEDREHGRNAGADAYLVKPFSFLKLLETIDTLRDKPARVH
jgi:two-component system, OmpR family, phosphate regulon response regulator PhoB